MKQTEHQFMVALFKNQPFRVINGTAYRNIIDGKRTIRIALNTSGMRGHYTKLSVHIYNQYDGLIIVEPFVFNDFLVRKSTTNPNYEKDTFMVIEHCGWEWYINQPTQQSINAMFTEIEAFLEMYGCGA